MGIELSPEELAEYLDRSRTAVVSSIGKDGAPHAVPIWFIALDDVVYFRSMPGQQKAVNLLRNPKMCLVVEDGEAWQELRAVMIRGEAREVTDPAELARCRPAFDRKYTTLMPPSDIPDATRRHYDRPRVWFRVGLRESRVTSWNNRKIRRRPPG